MGKRFSERLPVGPVSQVGISRAGRAPGLGLSPCMVRWLISFVRWSSIGRIIISGPGDLGFSSIGLPIPTGGLELI